MKRRPYTPPVQRSRPTVVRSHVVVPGCETPLPTETEQQARELAALCGGTVVPAGKDEQP